jgi:hypothetical protein
VFKIFLPEKDLIKTIFSTMRKIETKYTKIAYVGITGGYRNNTRGLFFGQAGTGREEKYQKKNNQ